MVTDCQEQWLSEQWREGSVRDGSQLHQAGLFGGLGGQRSWRRQHPLRNLKFIFDIQIISIILKNWKSEVSIKRHSNICFWIVMLAEEVVLKLQQKISEVLSLWEVVDSFRRWNCWVTCSVPSGSLTNKYRQFNSLNFIMLSPSPHTWNPPAHIISIFKFKIQFSMFSFQLESVFNFQIST